MTEQGQPVPQRIGDAERDRAVELLREHMTAGRLTAEEFDDRLGTALSARTSSDLEPLFSDLPGPRPGQELATTTPAPPTPSTPGSHLPHLPAERPVHGNGNPALAVLTGVMWPATILIITFLLDWSTYWWLIFVPVIISSVLGKDSHDRRERERRKIERDQRELDRRRRSLGD